MMHDKPYKSIGDLNIKATKGKTYLSYSNNFFVWIVNNLASKYKRIFTKLTRLSKS
jgi:hypothetical protein